MAIEEQINMHGGATGKALLSSADNISTDLRLQRSRLAHRKSRKEIFTTIHALRDQGPSCSEIERQTGFKRRSVAKWLAFPTPPDRRRAALKPTSPRYFEKILSDSWKERNRRGRHLFHEIQQQGYEGGYSHLERLFAGWRRAEKQAAGPHCVREMLAPSISAIPASDLWHRPSPSLGV